MAGLQGKVVDNTGAGISGLDIVATYTDPNTKKKVTIPGVTNAAGVFSFAGLPNDIDVQLIFPSKKNVGGNIKVIDGLSSKVFSIGAAVLDLNLIGFGDIEYLPPTQLFGVLGLVTRETIQDGQLTVEPFPGIQVKVLDNAQNLVFQGKTGPGGEYEIIRKSSVGRHSFQFEKRVVRGSSTLVLDPNEFDANLDFVKGIPVQEYKIQRGTLVVQVSGKSGNITEPLENVEINIFERVLKNATQFDLTDSTGSCTFYNVFPGMVDIILPRSFAALDGTIWELDEKRPNKLSANIKPGETSTLAVTYLPDKHILEWTVNYSDGSPAPGVLVEVYDKIGTTFIAEARTDNEGKVSFDLDKGDDYTVKVYGDDRNIAPERTFKNISVRSVCSGSTTISMSPRAGMTTFPTGATVVGTGGGNGNGGIGEAVKDIASYPILTEDISGGGRVASDRSGSGTTRLGSLVEGAIRDVIGWRPKTTDPRGFAAALGKSFTTTEIEGRTETKWTPGTSALQVEADLGAITGAQASIYTRAKLAIDQSVPLLEGLESLRNDPDEEDSDAARSIVDSALRALGTEFGLVGGPRVRRVDELFKTLRGEPDTTKEYPENEYEDSSALGKLAVEFGLDRDNVNTIEEEQNLTNFIIIVDHVSSLKDTWDKNKTFFDRRQSDPTKREVFLGTQLVLVSRSLASVAESVREIEFALDSVFIGPSERQNLSLEYADQPLFLSELLSWVDSFASDEGPRLIRDAGMDGVESILPTLENLEGLVKGALVCTGTGTTDCQLSESVPPGYKTTRVQRAIKELADHLTRTKVLCDQIIPDENGG